MRALVFNPSPPRWVACKLLGRWWRGAYWSRLSGLSYREVAVPDLPNEGWVRLRGVLGGICGTDLGLIMQRSHPGSILRAMTSFPLVLGHENVAVIDRVGSEVPGWSVGQRVCVEPAISCSVRGIEPCCRPCSRGWYSMCEHVTGSSLPAGTMLGMNSFTSGSWAPYFIAHHSQLRAVPDALDDETAVLVDPLACALHAVLRRVPPDDEHVVVMGGGIIGLGIVACLRALACRCTVTALVRHDHQAERMHDAGADHAVVSSSRASKAERYAAIAPVAGGRRLAGPFGNQTLIGGFDTAYDCVGSGQSLTDCMNFVRARGTVVEVGTTQINIVDSTALWMSELTVLGAYGRALEQEGDDGRHTYEMVFDLMTAGKLNVRGWLSRTYRPSDYRRALADLTSSTKNGIIKAAFSAAG
ncbi:MAG: alcohol dehydrogenase catalytic domain-containing protein [bacterium]|nr:alcohol dehydrogenase catalytic domain-containing protein [bacterium]